MDPIAQKSYLEAQILTASPQKLRLMLIEAAIGSAQRTLAHWEEGAHSEAVESLIRCRNIVTELLSGIKPDDSDLARRVAGIYVFLFKALTEAQLRRDRQRLREVVSILEIERETWRQVCEAMPHPPSAAAHGSVEEEVTASDAAQMLSGAGAQPRQIGSSTSRFVLDA
jgi:flagellar protein FliS